MCVGSRGQIQAGSLVIASASSVFAPPAVWIKSCSAYTTPPCCSDQIRDGHLLDLIRTDHRHNGNSTSEEAVFWAPRSVSGGMTAVGEHHEYRVCRRTLAWTVGQAGDPERDGEPASKDDGAGGAGRRHALAQRQQPHQDARHHAAHGCAGAHDDRVAVLPAQNDRRDAAPCLPTCQSMCQLMGTDAQATEGLTPGPSATHSRTKT